jgi:hypothetical protein
MWVSPGARMRAGGATVDALRMRKRHVFRQNTR